MTMHRIVLAATVLWATIKFYISGLDATAGTGVTNEVGFYLRSLPPGTYKLERGARTCRFS
jgi:hypothetical protein